MVSRSSFLRIVRLRRPRRLVLFPAVVLAAALPFAACGEDSRDDRGAAPVAEKIKKNRYQAVILANDRVYFGHLRAMDGDWFELRDAYFIRERAANAKGAEPTQQVAPITQELQRPEQRMVIRGSQIVVIENLENASPVAKAIDDLETQ